MTFGRNIYGKVLHKWKFCSNFAVVIINNLTIIMFDSFCVTRV